MEIFRFRTNLKCNNCVAKVKTQLDTAIEIKNWTVDLESPERILTIEAEDDGVVALVGKIFAEAGYRAERCPG